MSKRTGEKLITLLEEAIKVATAQSDDVSERIEIRRLAEEHNCREVTVRLLLSSIQYWIDDQSKQVIKNHTGTLSPVVIGYRLLPTLEPCEECSILTSKLYRLRPNPHSTALVTMRACSNNHAVALLKKEAARERQLATVPNITTQEGVEHEHFSTEATA
ncbi:MAG: hypothetical protein AB1631_19780 [Acidobacteriota bacterium]